MQNDIKQEIQKALQEGKAVVIKTGTNSIDIKGKNVIVIKKEIMR